MGLASRAVGLRLSPLSPTPRFGSRLLAEDGSRDELQNVGVTAADNERRCERDSSIRLEGNSKCFRKQLRHEANDYDCSRLFGSPTALFSTTQR